MDRGEQDFFVRRSLQRLATDLRGFFRVAVVPNADVRSGNLDGSVVKHVADDDELFVAYGNQETAAIRLRFRFGPIPVPVLR